MKGCEMYEDLDLTGIAELGVEVEAEACFELTADGLAHLLTHAVSESDARV